jgi:hypothetical protein
MVQWPSSPKPTNNPSNSTKRHRSLSCCSCHCLYKRRIESRAGTTARLSYFSDYLTFIERDQVAPEIPDDDGVIFTFHEPAFVAFTVQVNLVPASLQELDFVMEPKVAAAL